ncbi:MAG: hypothetical protein RIB98_14795 [Acidimicrobiales bacterium]
MSGKISVTSSTRPVDEPSESIAVNAEKSHLVGLIVVEVLA